MLFVPAAIPQGLKAAFVVRIIVGDKSPTYQPRPIPSAFPVKAKALTLPSRICPPRVCVSGLVFETMDA